MQKYLKQFGEIDYIFTNHYSFNSKNLAYSSLMVYEIVDLQYCSIFLLLAYLDFHSYAYPRRTTAEHEVLALIAPLGKPKNHLALLI
jgi:hypothetical protein